MNKVKLIVAGGLVTALFVALLTARGYWISTGEARTQIKWDAQVLQLKAAAAQREAELLQQVRDKESQIQKQDERNNHALLQRDQAIQASTASAVAADQRLQRYIANNRARHGQLPTPSTHARASTSVDGSTTSARQLLGQCSSQYTNVAEQADRLANQVIGLQDYARLCQER